MKCFPDLCMSGYTLPPTAIPSMRVMLGTRLGHPNPLPHWDASPGLNLLGTHPPLSCSFMSRTWFFFGIWNFSFALLETIKPKYLGVGCNSLVLSMSETQSLAIKKNIKPEHLCSHMYPLHYYSTKHTGTPVRSSRHMFSRSWKGWCPCWYTHQAGPVHWWFHLERVSNV